MYLIQNIRQSRRKTEVYKLYLKNIYATIKEIGAFEIAKVQLSLFQSYRLLSANETTCAMN
jgi:hypothetical protein